MFWIMVELLFALVLNLKFVVLLGMVGLMDLLFGWFKWVGLVLGVVGFGMCVIMMIFGCCNCLNMVVDGVFGILWVLGGLFLMILFCRMCMFLCGFWECVDYRVSSTVSGMMLGFWCCCFCGLWV